MLKFTPRELVEITHWEGGAWAQYYEPAVRHIRISRVTAAAVKQRNIRSMWRLAAGYEGGRGRFSPLAGDYSRLGPALTGSRGGRTRWNLILPGYSAAAGRAAAQAIVVRSALCKPSLDFPRGSALVSSMQVRGALNGKTEDPHRSGRSRPAARSPQAKSQSPRADDEAWY